MGLMLEPANTDAINRAPATSYGEATGITQTVRNFGSSLGMAVLGTILITQNKVNIEDSLGGFGIPKGEADSIADSMSESAAATPPTSPARPASRRRRSSTRCRSTSPRRWRSSSTRWRA